MSDFDVPNELCGCIIIPDETAGYHEAMAASGIASMYADAPSVFEGFGDDRDVFLWDWEIKLFGKMLPTRVQKTGVCCGEGFGRSMQDTINSAWIFGTKVGRKFMLAWEPWYALSRTVYGHPNWVGDGSCPPWMAMTAHEGGLLERGTYGSIDLTNPREDLASQWSSARGRVPAPIVNLCNNLKASSAKQLKTKQQVRDCIASRRGVARCAPRATGKVRDSQGRAHQVASGGHCQAWRASFYDANGVWSVVEQQSWPVGACPAGGGPIRLRDGTTRELPEGAAVLFPEDVDYCLDKGEIWGIDAPTTLPNDVSATESEIV